MSEVEYGEFDVSERRSDFIGGSDIACIMGLSSFKRRWQLLLEKAQLAEDSFPGNRFTEYGRIIEPQIRDYINQKYNTCFEPNRVINGDIRCHTDGFNGECVLEIKSTSTIYADVNSYKVYLVQLVKYMEENHVTKGKLAVYDRPEDLNPVFDKERLQIFDIVLDDYKPLLAKVNKEIDRFRADLKRLKENPLLSEQDFMPLGNNLVSLSQKIVTLENQLAAMKEIEQQCKDAKQALYNEMVKHDVKSWVTPNGTKITRVDGTQGSTKTVSEFDTEAFRAENPAMYHRYLREVEKKTNGKSGYVRISLGRS